MCWLGKQEKIPTKIVQMLQKPWSDPYHGKSKWHISSYYAAISNSNLALCVCFSPDLTFILCFFSLVYTQVSAAVFCLILLYPFYLNQLLSSIASPRVGQKILCLLIP